ncbi:MAG: DUF5667 domain-containing protein [Candidatus Woykebacteria bacterium]
MQTLKSQKGIAPLVLLAVIGVVVVGVSATAVASNGSKPGDLLYGIDRAVEGIQLAMANAPEAKAQAQIALAQERLQELEALQNAGAAEDKIAEATVRYEQHLEDALAKAQEAKSQGKDTEEVLAIITENTLRHQATLSDVYDKVPEEAQPAIQKAQEVSARGFEEASSAISGEKLEEVINKVKTDIPTIEDKVPAEMQDKIQNPSVPTNTPEGRP